MKLRIVKTGLIIFLVIFGYCIKGVAKDPKDVSPDDVQLSYICGPNCLFALHAVFGDHSMTIGSIAKECGYNWGLGVNFLEIKKYLMQKGFQISAEKIALHEVQNHSFFLIPVKLRGKKQYNHYYLILGKKGNSYAVFDGSGSILNMDGKELMKIWEGESIIIKKAPLPNITDINGIEFTSIQNKVPFYLSTRPITIEEYNLQNPNLLNSIFENDSTFKKIDNNYCDKKGNIAMEASCRQIEDFIAGLGTSYALPKTNDYKLAWKDVPEIFGKGLAELIHKTMPVANELASNKYLLFQNQGAQYSFYTLSEKDSNKKYSFRVVYYHSKFD